MPPRVLLDASVLWAGFVGATGASRRLLRAVLAERTTAIASTAPMPECEEVLLRPETLGRAGVAARGAPLSLDGLCGACRPAAIRARWRPRSADADDGRVPDAAVDGLADAIATFTLRDLRAPAARFGVAAETPADVLWRIG